KDRAARDGGYGALAGLVDLLLEFCAGESDLVLHQIEAFVSQVAQQPDERAVTRGAVPMVAVTEAGPSLILDIRLIAHRARRRVSCVICHCSAPSLCRLGAGYSRRSPERSSLAWLS